MCNPIASTIIERNKMMEIAIQNHQEALDRRIGSAADGSANSGSNSSPDITRSEEDPPVSSAEFTPAIAVNSNSSPIVMHVSSMNQSMTNDGENEESPKKSSSNSENNPGMDTIREYDVLMGRGSGPNRHSGNIHFRAIVGEVFDEFLSKHGTDVNSGSDMLRIDPSTKNRLAQTVLDKITIEKKGRFLQKLNKKEVQDAIEKGEDSKLIKAKAMSLMDAAMTRLAAVAAERDNASGDGKSDDPNKPDIQVQAAVYYKIIPEKQILAKIKQTFRFLRDQNEASNAEKHRQRIRRVDASATGVVGIPREQQSLIANSLSSVSAPGAVAATYALMDRLGGGSSLSSTLSAINPSPLSDQLSFPNRAGSSSLNPSSSGSIWEAARNLNSIGLPPSSSLSMSSLKNPDGAVDYSKMTSRLLDLPQPQRILSTADATGASSLLQGSPLTTAVSQLDSSSSGKKIPSTLESSTKRLIEELTLSRLANLQKQREETINAYLAMERNSSSAPAPAGIASTVPPPIDRLLSLNSARAPGAPTSALPITSTGSAPGLGGLTSSTSEPLSLLLQMSSSGSSGNRSRAPGSHPLRAFNSF